jgi:hypothetical protein
MAGLSNNILFGILFSFSALMSVELSVLKFMDYQPVSSENVPDESRSDVSGCNEIDMEHDDIPVISALRSNVPLGFHAVGSGMHGMHYSGNFSPSVWLPPELSE